MSHQPKVIISSTARDLPEHRKEVSEACLRQGMFPMMMEHLPATDAEAISTSLNLVDEAEIYVGLFAHRYPLVHADACNVLAQVECDEGNERAAAEAARRAYELAWCDGPPFAYHWRLVKAAKHLRELGADEPEMPPLDAAKFEPMPEVEIDPEDEFHAGVSE